MSTSTANAGVTWNDGLEGWQVDILLNDTKSQGIDDFFILAQELTGYTQTMSNGITLTVYSSQPELVKRLARVCGLRCVS